MGDALSGVLGTDSQVDVAKNTNAYQAIGGWQDRAKTLADVLQAQANGGGPNPAQLQYLQNAQQIAQQQATNYAQNRSVNAGLAARMAGNTAANVGQSAAAQAGVQQAQQQLGSQQLLGNVLGQQEQAVNHASAINAGVASGNQQMAAGITGGIMNGVGGILSGSATGGGAAPTGKYKGGVIRGYDDGGLIMPTFGSSLNPPQMAPSLGVAGVPPTAVQSAPSLGVDTRFSTPSYEDITKGIDKTQPSQSMPNNNIGAGNSGADALAKGMSSFIGGISGNNFISNQMKSIGSMFGGGGEGGGGGAAAMAAMAAAGGGVIPGQAQVSGDAPQNDTVPAMLSPGEIVVPRSHASDPEMAKDFVEHILKQKGKSDPESGDGYGKVLALEKRLASLEKRVGKK